MLLLQSIFKANLLRTLILFSNIQKTNILSFVGKKKLVIKPEFFGSRDLRLEVLQLFFCRVDNSTKLEFAKAVEVGSEHMCIICSHERSYNFRHLGNWPFIQIVGLQINPTGGFGGVV